jgi:ribonuclease HI
MNMLAIKKELQLQGYQGKVYVRTLKKIRDHLEQPALYPKEDIVRGFSLTSDQEQVEKLIQLCENTVSLWNLIVREHVYVDGCCVFTSLPLDVRTRRVGLGLYFPDHAEWCAHRRGMGWSEEDAAWQACAWVMEFILQKPPQNWLILTDHRRVVECLTSKDSSSKVPKAYQSVIYQWKHLQHQPGPYYIEWKIILPSENEQADQLARKNFIVT